MAATTNTLRLVSRARVNGSLRCVDAEPAEEAEAEVDTPYVSSPSSTSELSSSSSLPLALALDFGLEAPTLRWRKTLRLGPDAEAEAEGEAEVAGRTTVERGVVVCGVWNDSEVEVDETEGVVE